MFTQTPLFHSILALTTVFVCMEVALTVGTYRNWGDLRIITLMGGGHLIAVILTVLALQGTWSLWVLLAPILGISTYFVLLEVWAGKDSGLSVLLLLRGLSICVTYVATLLCLSLI